VKAGHSVALAAYSACGENRRRAIQKFATTSLKRSQITRIPPQISRQLLEGRRALLVRQDQQDVTANLLERLLPGRLDVGQFENVKTESSSNRFADIARLHFDRSFHKIRGHSLG
jgi:hypothetical protein